MLLYLMFISVMLAQIANNSETVTPCELMFGLLPFILLVDFGFRFMAQQTPSQQIKPYILLPIGKYACIDSFLFNSITSTSNLIWFALFLPYAIMSIVFSYGLMAALGFLLAWYLLIVCNSLWYMLVRTLVNKSYWWWLLPAVVYAIILSPWYLGEKAGIENLYDTYSTIGEAVSHWSILAFGGILLLMAILVIINRYVQYNSVYAELSRSEQTKLRHVSELKSLDRYGEVGEYIKLEIKSIMRNKNMRKGFISAVAIVTAFSLLLSFTMLIVPMIDVVRVVIARTLHRRPLFQADKNHIHHKLMRAGMTQHQALITILLLALAFTTINVTLSHLGYYDITLIVLVDLLVFVLFMTMVNKRIRKNGAQPFV